MQSMRREYVSDSTQKKRISDVPQLIDMPPELIPEKRHAGPPYFAHHLQMVMDLVVTGSTVAEILRDNPTWFLYTDLMKIIHSDPELMNMFHYYQELRSEAWADQVKLAAEGKNWDGSPALEDTQRSSLRVSTLFRLMECHNQKRYGKKQELNINSKIDITEAMRRADDKVRRLDEARGITIEHSGE